MLAKTTQKKDITDACLNREKDQEIQTKKNKVNEVPKITPQGQEDTLQNMITASESKSSNNSVNEINSSSPKALIGSHEFSDLPANSVLGCPKLVANPIPGGPPIWSHSRNTPSMKDEVTEFPSFQTLFPSNNIENPK